MRRPLRLTRRCANGSGAKATAAVPTPRRTPTARIPAAEITIDRDPGRDQGQRNAASGRARSSCSKWDFDRARHARRRPARHAVVHQADAVVRPRDGADGRPEVQAAGVHALRRRGRRRRLADEERAREERPRGSRSPTASRRTRSARSPSTRTTRPARRSTSAPARRTTAATARPGLGLYKTTDDGAHWSLVPGSFAVANNRAIAWVAIEPGNANHILIGTRSGARGIGSNSTSVAAAAARRRRRRLRLDRRRRDVHAHAGRLDQRGQVRPEQPERRLRRTVATVGLVRSTAGGAAGSWETIFSLNRGRFSFSPVTLPNGKTRIYLSDASGGGQGAQVYRVDDASQPAATLTASNNAAWTRLSNPTPRARPASPSTTTATRRSSARSACTTCSSSRRPTGPTWSSSAGSCTTRS